MTTKKQIKAIKVKTQVYLFAFVNSGQIFEIKAISIEGAIAQVNAQYGDGAAELINL